MDSAVYKKRFDEYASRYDFSDGRIHLKLLHTYEVCGVMERLTAALGLSEEIRSLACLCALFHDIARFPQLADYGTYNDAKSFDHGDMGSTILVEEKILEGLPEEDQKAVLTAIRRHNKFEIGEVVNEKTLLLCRLIRDADKCDIYRVFACEDMVDTMGETLEQIAGEKVSDIVMETILAHRCIDKYERRTGIDVWIGFLAFVYDLNFAESVRIIREAGYYRRQFDAIRFTDPETERRVRMILADLEAYMDTCC